MSAADDQVAQARALHMQGRIAEAEAIYAAILAREPRHFEANHLLGLAALQTGRVALAVGTLERAVAIAPTAAKAHNNLGNALRAAGDTARAAACFEQARRLDPALPGIDYNLGTTLLELGRHADAAESMARAVALAPGDAEALNNLGTALHQLGRHAEALARFDAAVAAQPGLAVAHAGRANALVELGRPDEALAACDRATTLAPGLADAWYNRGIALQEGGRIAEAVASYDHAIALAPDSAGPRWNKSLLLLLQGRLEEGWELYEWRKRTATPSGARVLPRPFWDGRAALRGRTILLHHEQGLGDTIQFARYAPLLARQGARVVLSLPAALVPLFRQWEPAVQVVAQDSEPKDYDLHSPLLSLPRSLGTTLATIPREVPYLAADPARIAGWAGRIGPDGFRIGICWQGSTRAIDRGRSFPLAAFAPLAALPGVRLVSLHKGAGEAQLRDLPPGMRVETPGPDFDPPGAAFLDTAALMVACDLVITSDTAVAHLAGALGVPCWVVLKHIPDWRWLLGREDSPWYPTLRLFRQDRPGDWSGAFATLAAALHPLLEGGRR